MKTSALIEAHFLPSLEYFCALQPFNQIIIEQHERFVKQSCRNRCYIRTSQRVEMLSVPLTSKHHGANFRDVRIDYSRKWPVTMWRTIMSAYRNSPFFEHYADDLNKTLSRRHEFIFDLDLALLSFCLKSLRWEKVMSTTTTYTELPPAHVDDLRSFVTSREGFEQRDLYRAVPYYQVFGEKFAENLSLIDLLFCKGPEAGKIITASRGNRLNK